MHVSGCHAFQITPSLPHQHISAPCQASCQSNLNTLISQSNCSLTRYFWPWRGFYFCKQKPTCDAESILKQPLWIICKPWLCPCLLYCAEFINRPLTFLLLILPSFYFHPIPVLPVWLSVLVLWSSQSKLFIESIFILKQLVSVVTEFKSLFCLKLDLISLIYVIFQISHTRLVVGVSPWP